MWLGMRIGWLSRIMLVSASWLGWLLVLLLLVPI